MNARMTNITPIEHFEPFVNIKRSKFLSIKKRNSQLEVEFLNEPKSCTLIFIIENDDDI